ncbi:hypothetical protein C8A00DRAFT_14749 [Chaetomidium leptoderma]|uniref:Uncharacterized protein n=1 Tax=Chaetomidium leptoderma TaxID=669021 RepID=A0AAN6ZW30_9PEZI|nr:hypothetical protein C8A00DRAFT_14749 [Chaetomidium leptoderma]
MAQDLDGCNAPPSEAAISALATFHGILCAKTEECWRESRAHHARWVEEDPVGANSWSIKVPRHESHLLRPLFRALMAIVCCADYDGEDSTTAGRFPVCLVRTGVEDGLSAPISFHAEVVAHRMKYLSDNVVETTLEAAVDFIMALEAREAAVFGIQPDPASVVEVPMDEEGHELTRLPSTQWVSDEKAAEWGWCGKGRYWDEVWGARFEQRAFRSHKSLLFELQMLREGRELPATLTIGDLTTVFRTEKGEGKDSVSAD